MHGEGYHLLRPKQLRDICGHIKNGEKGKPRYQFIWTSRRTLKYTEAKETTGRAILLLKNELAMCQPGCCVLLKSLLTIRIEILGRTASIK
jgi:hypothetical protein